MNNDMNDKLFELYTLAELSYKNILVILVMMNYFLVIGTVIRIIKRK